MSKTRTTQTIQATKQVRSRTDKSQMYSRDITLESATEVTARDVNATLRATEAMKLAAGFLSWKEIAARCGYSNGSAAYNAVQRELRRTVILNADELRTRELHMLDELHRSIWPEAVDTNNKWRLTAVDRLVTISERRAKLMGLDIPIDKAQFSAQIVVREVPQGLFPEGMLERMHHAQEQSITSLPDGE